MQWLFNKETRVRYLWVNIHSTSFVLCSLENGLLPSLCCLLLTLPSNILSYPHSEVLLMKLSYILTLFVLVTNSVKIRRLNLLR